MEQVCEEAPLAPENRAGSQEALMEPSVTGPSRNSNGRALKIAAITTLACLLVSAQAFTAYMVFDQRQRIQELQMNHQTLQGQMSRKSFVSPQKINLPSWPVLDVFDDMSLSENSPTSEAPVRPSVEEELQKFMKDVELPHFNQSFLDNLRTMRENVDETSWKEFESWLRYWLLFQKAQKTEMAETTIIAESTKCQIEAGADGRDGLLGSFRPQCDEQGNYKSKQCWPSTGQCWCVDEFGVQIPQTYSRHHWRDCDKVRASRTSSDSVIMKALSDDEEQQIQE